MPGDDVYTVLVVDDTPENIHVLVEALAGLRIKTARDGRKALELARAEPLPDCILLDILMPGMDGYEVCSRLKRSQKTKDIPVIFVTSMSEEKDEAEGLALGAVDYITKPISTPIVRARVKAHLELKKARENLVRQNELLEERVVERTARILHLHKEREESLRNFASAVAHQMRNPVQAIAGMSGLMLKKLDADHPVVEYAEAVREGCLRLQGMSDAVAEYTSLAPGDADIVSSSRIAEDAAALGAEYAREAGCCWDCSVEVEETLLDVDPDFLLRALSEPVRNAVDFRTENRVEVRILGRSGSAFVSGDKSEAGDFGPAEENGEVCESREKPEESAAGPRRYFLTVESRGGGVSEDLLPFVCDPFFSSKALGTGMGLTKALRIAEELGGTLRIINTYDEKSDPCGVRVTLDVAVL